MTTKTKKSKVSEGAAFAMNEAMSRAWDMTKEQRKMYDAAKASALEAARDPEVRRLREEAAKKRKKPLGTNIYKTIK